MYMLGSESKLYMGGGGGGGGGKRVRQVESSSD